MFLSGAGNADDSNAKNLSSQPSAFSHLPFAICHLLFAAMKKTSRKRLAFSITKIHFCWDQP